jgi:hypothetical protein
VRFTIIDFTGQMYTTDGITEEGDKRIVKVACILAGYNSIAQGNVFEFLASSTIPGYTITLTKTPPKIRQKLIV